MICVQVSLQATEEALPEEVCNAGPTSRLSCQIKVTGESIMSESTGLSPRRARNYRVVQWATGNIGMRSLRAVIEHPGLSLAGLYVYSDAKAGRDAGEFDKDWELREPEAH